MQRQSSCVVRVSVTCVTAH